MSQPAPALLLNLDVPNLESARDFYVRAFGFHVGRALGPRALELWGAGVPLYLLEQPEGTTPAPGAAPRNYERHWSPLHLDVVVEDIETALARAEQAGARRESEVTTSNWGKLVRLSDPFGHGVCLVQFLNLGYDELVDPAAAGGSTG